MVKKSKGKHRLDKYYHLAKEQGFRSRAAFKLIQLNRKYGFLQNCKALLDLCAAPGGWMQVAAKNMPLSSLILGVDLAPIKPIRGCRSYISDITTAQCRQLLKKEAAGSLFDVVLHDGAPNVGGAWSSEAYTQSVLVVDALALAVEFLAPGGTFVTKVFRSKDYNALLYAFGQLFNKVEATKPQASRNASAEIFVVCLGYKAPAKVDPRLLDPKHLFMEVAEAPKVMGPEALLKQKIKQKRHREGYEEGLSSSHKVASAVSFLLSSNAVEMLGQVTKLALDGPAAEQTEGEPEQQQVDAQQLAAAVRSHPSTDGEIKALCSDLQVLGRSEFKQLLRWRLGLRRDLKALLGGAGAAADEEGKKGSHKKQPQQQQGEGDEEGEEGGEQEDAEQKLLAEMEAIRDAADKRVRKEKRKRREVKKKAKVRTAQLLAAEGGEDNSGAPDDEQLFGLGVLDAAAAGIAAKDGGKAAAAAAAAAAVLKKVSSAAAPGARELELLEQPDEDEQWSDDGSDASSLDSDEAALHYEAELEEQLDNAYASYLERKGVRDAAAKEKRQRLGKGGELGEDEEGEAPAAAADADSESDDPEEYGARLQQEAEEASEDEAAAAAGAGGGLLVQLDASRAGVAKGGAAAAAQWFGQDLFEDPNVEVSSEEEDEQPPQQQQQQKIQLKRQKQQAPEPAAAADEQPQQQQRSTKRQKTAVANGVAANGAAHNSGSGGEDLRGSDSSDSEVGSASEGDGSDAELDSDEEEFNALDNDGKAEVLALAKKMLRRKDKDSIVEAAYNRYAFHDDKLPRWFAEDERRHMRPLPQVTKEDIEAEKARLAAIDARPIKKVAEAKARKQKRLQARLDAARAKATSIAAQDDVPMASKMREIEKVYAKAKAGGGAKGKGKGGKAAGGRKGKGPPLDKRMRKDKRGMDRAAARKKGPKKGGVRKKGGRR